MESSNVERKPELMKQEVQAYTTTSRLKVSNTPLFDHFQGKKRDNNAWFAQTGRVIYGLRLSVKGPY
jgi:hypothetical protein